MHARLNGRIAIPTLGNTTVLKEAEPEDKSKSKEVDLRGTVRLLCLIVQDELGQSRS